MTHASELPPSAPGAAVPLSPEMLQKLHREDRRTATLVAMMMSLVFLAGLVLYVAIAYWTAVGP